MGYFRVTPNFWRYVCNVHGIIPLAVYIMFLGVSPGSKLCTTLLKIAKYYKTVRLRLIFQSTYSTEHKYIEKLTATAPQPFYNVFKFVVHSLEPGETPSYSASHQAPNYVQRS